jgi:hypothetical protein
MQKCHKSQQPFSSVGPVKYLAPVMRFITYFIALHFYRKRTVNFRDIYSGKNSYITWKLIAVICSICRPIFFV